MNIKSITLAAGIAAVGIGMCGRLSQGAEIVLQARAIVRGSVVRLCDVAGVAGADSAGVLRLADTPLMPAPAPGTTTYLRLGRLREILRSRGVDVRGATFRGADYAEISSEELDAAATTELPRQQATARAASPDDDAAIPEQLTAAISEYLRQQTGHELWKVQVEVDPPATAAVRKANGQVVVGGGKAPWAGRQRFSVGGDGQASATVYARIDRMEMAVFAIRSLNRGDLVRRGDVELRPHVGALPSSALVSLDAAIGKEAVNAIRADSLLAGNQVRLPTIVRRGERVSVQARAAGVTVRTYALAQQDGGLGDLVTVQALDGKERYAARVSGLRELEVMAAGAAASDVAAVVR